MEWSFAPLRRPRPIGGWLVDHQARRVVPLVFGITLLANEERLRDHRFPAKWFEAAVALVEISGRRARISDARATNGVFLHGVALPGASWTRSTSEEDVAALEHGSAADRIARLVPVWHDLRDGDDLVMVYPRATWTFHVA